MSLPADLAAWLRIALTSGIGPETFRRLLSAFGDPDRILSAGISALARVVPTPVARALVEGPASEALDKVAVWLGDSRNHVVTFADADYPRQLLDITDPPPLIYVTGRRDLLNHPAIAVVGSRSATAQGTMTAESFSRALSDAGLTIVSGLALGIDTAAHRGGLAGRSSSVGVVGTGLDVVYPARNRELAAKIAESGSLISEFPLGTPPIGSNFPRRNRVLSGLARGCLVIEAALASGSLITARLANEQGKDVFAVPGSIHSPQSKGCHLLIKQGAKLTESAHDVMEELGLHTFALVSKDIPVSAPADELLALAGYDPFDVDTLSERSGKAAEDVLAAITQYELDGRITSLPGGRYQRTR